MNSPATWYYVTTYRVFDVIQLSYKSSLKFISSLKKFPVVVCGGCYVVNDYTQTDIVCFSVSNGFQTGMENVII